MGCGLDFRFMGRPERGGRAVRAPARRAGRRRPPHRLRAERRPCFIPRRRRRPDQRRMHRRAALELRVHGGHRRDARPARAQRRGDGEHLAQFLVRHPARRPATSWSRCEAMKRWCATPGAPASRSSATISRWPASGAGSASRSPAASAVTAVFDRRRDRHRQPAPRRHGRQHALPPGASRALRRRPSTSRRSGTRLERFLQELVPVAEEAGVRLAAHPDDPPVERLRGTARLVNSHAKYDRLLGARAEPGQRAGILRRLAGRDARGRRLRDDAPFRARGRHRLCPFPQRAGPGAALRRDLRRRRRRRHGRDRAGAARGGLRRRAGARPCAGARLPGALARRARLYGRLHEGAGRPRGGTVRDAPRPSPPQSAIAAATR